MDKHFERDVTSIRHQAILVPFLMYLKNHLSLCRIKNPQESHCENFHIGPISFNPISDLKDSDEQKTPRDEPATQYTHTGTKYIGVSPINISAVNSKTKDKLNDAIVPKVEKLVFHNECIGWKISADMKTDVISIDYLLSLIKLSPSSLMYFEINTVTPQCIQNYHTSIILTCYVWNPEYTNGEIKSIIHDTDTNGEVATTSSTSTTNLSEGSKNVHGGTIPIEINPSSYADMTIDRVKSLNNNMRVFWISDRLSSYSHIIMKENALIKFTPPQSNQSLQHVVSLPIQARQPPNSSSSNKSLQQSTQYLKPSSMDDIAYLKKSATEGPATIANLYDVILSFIKQYPKIKLNPKSFDNTDSMERERTLKIRFDSGTMITSSFILDLVYKLNNEKVHYFLIDFKRCTDNISNGNLVMEIYFPDLVHSNTIYYRQNVQTNFSVVLDIDLYTTTNNNNTATDNNNNDNQERKQATFKRQISTKNVHADGKFSSQNQTNVNDNGSSTPKKEPLPNDDEKHSKNFFHNILNFFKTSSTAGHKRKRESSQEDSNDLDGNKGDPKDNEKNSQHSNKNTDDIESTKSERPTKRQKKD